MLRFCYYLASLLYRTKKDVSIHLETSKKKEFFNGYKPNSVPINRWHSFICIDFRQCLPCGSATYPMSSDEQPDILHCLAPNRVYHTRSITLTAVSFYLAFSPLPFLAVYFLWHYSCTGVFSQHSDFSIGVLLYGVRTFLSR